MARIRSVHPGQWRDQDFVECSFAARLLAIALRNEADDQGVFEWKLKQIKMNCFPADSVDIEALLRELVANNVIKPFEVDGRKFGAVRNFRAYQKPKKPNCLYPLPDEFRNYVAITGSKFGTEASRDDSSELDDDEGATSSELTSVYDRPVPPKSEIDRQREEGGGNREDRRESSSLRSDTSAGADQADLAIISKPKATAPPSAVSDIRASVEIYNKIAAPLGWTECQKITKPRESSLRQRLRDCGGIEGWRKAMERAATSPFLRGETARSGTHENWKPDLEFFLSQKHFIKLLEGGYDGAVAAPARSEKPLTAEEIAATRRVCLRDWAAGKPWIKNISGNGIWRDEHGIGPPPDDPRTLITPEDLAAVPAAKERLNIPTDDTGTPRDMTMLENLGSRLRIA